MVWDVQEAETKYNDDHRDEIDAALAWQSRDRSGEEEGDEQPEQAPVMPVFNKQEFTAKWLSDNPQIEIPEPIVDDVDNDWILSQSETDYHINSYFGKE